LLGYYADLAYTAWVSISPFWLADSANALLVAEEAGGVEWFALAAAG